MIYNIPLRCILVHNNWISHQNALANFKEIIRLKSSKSKQSKQLFKYGEVTTFTDVCIEYGVNRTKQIVVYNQLINGSKVIRMMIRPRKRYHNRTWNLTLKTTNIPITHTILRTNAYFIAYSYFMNLGHFFFDTVENVYGTLKFIGDYRNGTLQSWEFHLLAHTWDVLTKSHKDKLDYQPFGPILHALGATYNDMYTTVEANTCYQLGVFGYTTSNIGPHEFEDALRNRMGINPSNCPHSNRRLITIVQREIRRFSNVREMKFTLLKYFPSVIVDIVDFANWTLHDQITQVSCSDVLIGVHGAALELQRFLKPTGGLLEIIWDHFPKYWYKEEVRHNGHVYETILNCDVTIPEFAWKRYFITFKNDTKENILKLSEKVRLNAEENIWKYADCRVDTNQLILKVNKIMNKNMISYSNIYKT